MDSEPDRELEMIRADAHQARANLADKLEALESQVTQTVSGVTSAVEVVSDTVATVTDAVTSATESVSETVETVKESVAETMTALDPSPHIRKAPWAAVGCALATGFATGYLVTGPRHGGRPTGPTNGPPAEANGHANADRGPTTWDHVGETVTDLGGAVRSLGVSALMGVVSHLAQKAVPEAMKQDVSTALDGLKTRLGGRHTVNPEEFLNL